MVEVLCYQHVDQGAILRLAKKKKIGMFLPQIRIEFKVIGNGKAKEHDFPTDKRRS